MDLRVQVIEIIIRERETANVWLSNMHTLMTVPFMGQFISIFLSYSERRYSCLPQGAATSWSSTNQNSLLSLHFSFLSTGSTLSSSHYCLPTEWPLEQQPEFPQTANAGLLVPPSLQGKKSSPKLSSCDPTVLESLQRPTQSTYSTNMLFLFLCLYLSLALFQRVLMYLNLDAPASLCLWTEPDLCITQNKSVSQMNTRKREMALCSLEQANSFVFLFLLLFSED